MVKTFTYGDQPATMFLQYSARSHEVPGGKVMCYDPSSCPGRRYLTAPIIWFGNHVAISGKKHKITMANIIHRT